MQKLVDHMEKGDITTLANTNEVHRTTVYRAIRGESDSLLSQNIRAKAMQMLCERYQRLKDFLAAHNYKCTQ